MCWIFPGLWRKPWSYGQLKIIVILIIYCDMPLLEPRAFLRDSLVASCWNTLKLDSVGIVNCQGNLSDTQSKQQRSARSLMRLHVLYFIFSPPTCFVLSYLCEIMFLRGFCLLWHGFVMFPLDPVENIQLQPTPVLLPGKSHGRRSLVAAVRGVAESQTQLSNFTFTFHFHALEKEMATHTSELAWRIPGTAEPGGLPSLGSHRVGHNWSDLAAAADPVK